MKKNVLVFTVIWTSVLTHELAAQTGWVFKDPMPTARAGICAAVLDGRIYVMGGRDDSGKVLDLVERYDPVSDSWESLLPPLGKLGVARENAAAVTLNGQVFVLGGRGQGANGLDKVEFLNLAENKWEGFADLVKEREALGAVVINGSIYAVGGGNGLLSLLFDDVEYYDQVTHRWQTVNNWALRVATAELVTVAVKDSAFAIGGASILGLLRFVQRYHTALGVSLRADLLDARASAAGAVQGDSIFVLGGRGGLLGLETFDSVELYNAKTNRWANFAPLNTARQNFAAVATNNSIYAIGGHDASGNVLSSVEAFELVTAVEDPVANVPEGFELWQNYPNPFNAGTKITYQVPPHNRALQVRLVVYNLRGQKVITLFQGLRLPGNYEVSWDGSDFQQQSLGSGIYIYTLEFDEHRISKKMILSR
ncbi:MAG TPA: kelch repeat-containing protein [bacterium]